MADDGLSEFDRVSADIPIWGWLSGAGARNTSAQNEADRNAARATWRQLGQGPSVDELTPTYQGEGSTDEYGDLLGGPSQLEGFGNSEDQRAALAAMRSLYEQGGYTAADRNAQAAARANQAQQVGAMNQAALRALEARGGGGGGGALAAQLSGSQALANANAQSDAALQSAAMQRAFAAMQGAGNQANAMQAQELSRRNALDAFNQQNMDWRRGRQTRNTNIANRGADARANAQQMHYGNAMDWAAGMTGQYTGAQSDRRQDLAMRDEADERGAETLGTIISSVI